MRAEKSVAFSTAIMRKSGTESVANGSDYML